MKNDMLFSKKKEPTLQGSLDKSKISEIITKYVYRQATDKIRPPSCSIFRALNHGTILFIYLCKNHCVYHAKMTFLKNQKKVPQKNWGVWGAKPPGWLKRLLEQVNITFLIMSKPFQSYLNPFKHAKNPENQILKSQN